MLQPYQFRVDYGKLQHDSRFRITDSKTPVISWAVMSDRPDSYQTAYRIAFSSSDKMLWQTDWIESAKQETVYAGPPLPFGCRIYFTVEIKDQQGSVSEKAGDYFYCGQTDHWEAGWIAASVQASRRAVCFQKSFMITKPILSAYCMVCGLGYHKIKLNGKAPDPSLLDPAHADYSQVCYYVLLPEIESTLREGENEISIEIGDGWRHLDSAFIKSNIGDRKLSFDGVPQVSAMFRILYTDGTSDTIMTDETWSWSHTPILSNNIYDGTIYDANSTAQPDTRAALPTHAASAKQPACAVPSPLQPGAQYGMRVQTLEPIREKEVYHPLSVTQLEGPDGLPRYLVDFGQNIAGIVRLKLPERMQAGQTIQIVHGEFLDEDGSIYTAPLREAKCTDIYIASGDGRDLAQWQPEFTYHGFRYIQVDGYGSILKKSAVTAIAIYTDIQSESFFTCGSALINQIHKNAVQTEKSNIHSILTDCPQRNERLGWMNDATVRFEETPYNFDIGRIFPKVVRDLICVQDGSGAITCTAPFVVGGRPADPVCSSFLVAGMQAAMHTGNLAILKEAYPHYKAWQQCLLDHSDGYIVNYSYYGDWAGPSYACHSEEIAVSAVTPGILISTGYSYLNCLLLSKMAGFLSYKQEQADYEQLAAQIRSAFLKKWFDPESARVDAGSQASQAFALWLGLIPEAYTQKAADLIHADLTARHYQITTGNLCTRYLMDVLAQYGYIDDAYAIITRETYPSIGYMIQNEATTIWERFELKKNPDMNSHNHPMYGAVDYWFYAYLCGIRPTAPGWEAAEIKPYYPSQLLSAHASVDTVKGPITVKWVKRYGALHLYVSVPFGVTAEIHTKDGIVKVGSGTHHYSWPL